MTQHYQRNTVEKITQRSAALLGVRWSDWLDFLF